VLHLTTPLLELTTPVVVVVSPARTSRLRTQRGYLSRRGRYRGPFDRGARYLPKPTSPSVRRTVNVEIELVSGRVVPKRHRHAHLVVLSRTTAPSDGLDCRRENERRFGTSQRWTVDRIFRDVTGAARVVVHRFGGERRLCWKDLSIFHRSKHRRTLTLQQSWFDLRHKFDEANPPGYRKHGDTRPRSTVTFKEDGFKHDPRTTASGSRKART